MTRKSTKMSRRRAVIARHNETCEPSAAIWHTAHRRKYGVPGNNPLLADAKRRRKFFDLIGCTDGVRIKRTKRVATVVALDGTRATIRFATIGGRSSSISLDVRSLEVNR